MSNITFEEITGINHELLPAWLDLYEVSFPPTEKVLISRFLRLLKAKSEGEQLYRHMIAAVNESRELVGIMRLDTNPETRIGYLWYLAVQPDSRNGGIGSKCFNEVIRRCEAEGMRGLVFEVEAPEELQDPALSALAARRIGFYRRHGAKRLTGIHYLQQVETHQPAIVMHIMLREIEPITPQQALEMADAVVDGVTQTGELGLQ